MRSVNAVVGETNDGGLNDIRGLHVTREHVQAALTNARSGTVDEGAVGAGTGTIASDGKADRNIVAARGPSGRGSCWCKPITAGG